MLLHLQIKKKYYFIFLIEKLYVFQLSETPLYFDLITYFR